MPSLHHGVTSIGLLLIIIGGSTTYLSSAGKRLNAFTLSILITGVLMLLLGLLWAMKGKNTPVPHQRAHSSILFTPSPRNRSPESQSVNLQRSPDRQRRGADEDLDYPPMEPTCFSSSGVGCPSRWKLDLPPPYEVAIKTTTSSTHLQRSYSDTLHPTEPLVGCSREISFEV